MASDRAMVLGFCGSKRLRPRLTAVEIGRAAGGLGAEEFYGLVFDPAEGHQFAEGLSNLPISEPPAIGTTTLSGRRQPSCSAISKP